MRNKEMIYSDKHQMEWIAYGSYDGFQYYIRNNGTHPCCYINIPDNSSIDFDKRKDYLKDVISCHGGLSYIEPLVWDPDIHKYLPGNFIGWDYSHPCDFVAGKNGHEGIKYKTDFLVNECLDVIEQLREVERYISNPRYIKVIAIDFDGVLCTNKYPEIGEPNWDIIQRALSEKEFGSKLVLWTCRCDEDLEEAVEACKEWGLEFDAVNDNIEEWKLLYGNNTRKVSATEYWDDHNVLVDDIMNNKR